MKLPKQYNLYKINEHLEKLAKYAQVISCEWDGLAEDLVCKYNLVYLKDMNAIITHLELALDEVLKLPGVSDER